MHWKYSGNEDSSGCRHATCTIGDDIYTYFGMWHNGQPSGLGAIRKNGQFYKASSEWINGETAPEYELTEQEYEQEMAWHQKQFSPYSTR